MNKYVMAITLVLALCVVQSAAGCVKVKNPDTKGPATFSEVTTDAAVSPEGRALHLVTKFIASTPTIYVSAKVNTAPEKTSIRARWVYVKDSTGKEVKQELFKDSTTVSGTKYVTFSHQSPSGSWQVGQYAIELYINDQEVTNAQFSIKELLIADVPAPTIFFFKALPEAINYGQAVTLSWSTSDAATVEISTVGVVGTAGNVIITPANSMEYALTASNAVGSTSKKVNIQVTSFITDKPELVITNFWVEGDKAFYKIKNIGGVEAKSSLTGIYINGLAAGQSKVEILAPDQERTYYFPNLTWSYGSQRSYKLPVRICADDYNVIGEYDEYNNCLVLDW